MKSLLVALFLAAGLSFVALAQGTVTVFEGARVIVGDGRVIENATVVVDGGKIAQVGRAADVKAPAGGNR